MMQLLSICICRRKGGFFMSIYIGAINYKNQFYYDLGYFWNKCYRNLSKSLNNSVIIIKLRDF